MNKSKKIKIISSVISCMGLTIGITNISSTYINNDGVKVLSENTNDIVDFDNIDNLFNNTEGETFEFTPEDGIKIECIVLTEPAIDKNGTVSVQAIDGISGHLIIPELVTHNGNNYHVTTISALAFSSSGEKYTGHLIVPKSITFIGKWAFSPSVEHIFENSNLTINSSTQNIPQGCFEACDFKNIRILSDTIKTIDLECFRKNSNISSIEIFSNITSIGSRAFANCDNLSEFTLLSETFVPYEQDMLSDTKISSGEGKIYVRSNLVDQYKSASGWSNFAESIEPLIGSVSLDQTNIKTTINEKAIKLNATVEGKYQDVIWSSSDESIVNVDQNGQLTYNDIGKAIINVESSFDSSKFATCEVEITEPVTNLEIKTTIDDIYGTKGTPITSTPDLSQSVYDNNGTQITSGLNFSISTGSLFTGLNIDSNTGVISGTPTATGTVAVVIKVTANSLEGFSNSFNIEINEPQPEPEPKNNNFALILGLSLGLGIPIVVGLGFGIYYFINKNKK